MGSEEQEIITLLQSNFITNYCELATCMLIFFEHIVTLPDEIRFIWRRKLTMSSLIFLLNRYILFLYGLVNVVGVIPWTTNIGSDAFSGFVCASDAERKTCRCAAIIMLYTVFTLLLYAITPIFSTLRVYAIAGRKWHFALATFLTGMVAVASNLANAVQASLGYLVYVGPLPVCTYNAYYSESEHLKLTIATRVCSIVSDLLVIVVTWWRTYALKREADRLHMRASLATLLLRDGTIYFVAILVLNIVHIIFVLYNGNVVYVTIFLIPIPALLTSRFLLNLRRANEASSIDVHLITSASTADPPSFTLSSAPPELRTLQFTPGGTATTVGARTGTTGTWMDMDGALWTGFASSVGGESESEEGTVDEKSEKTWSPSTESGGTKAEEGDVEKGRSPPVSPMSAGTGTTACVGGGGGQSREGVGVEEIELTPV
ncbi:uncharacterized protein C8Q71DRAFT_904709 [Rhodofomes roseus]|uniref:DUF6533 domain-containing protein n=1 Tax=Rhodofomes roseus TaxID=34475 RepID=A0ABQ8KPR6_9APHY|nr:uncharacterized protein C8Q71DRAFT_904709 [Rhodofomes roseus]KAH9840607.1 hypothetical protein C8Q71DRAFT_904709 [Rhodofomes roseus]